MKRTFTTMLVVGVATIAFGLERQVASQALNGYCALIHLGIFPTHLVIRSTQDGTRPLTAQCARRLKSHDRQCGAEHRQADLQITP